MHSMRLGRKEFFALVSATLLIFFLLELRPSRKHSLETSTIIQFGTEDPVELLLIEEDLSTSGSEAAHNATLGFQKILALSARPSWRTRGLAKLSMYTGLQIDVITAGRPDEKTIEDFLAVGPEKASKPDRGSTIAWLGHLAVLQGIVASGCRTTLVFEDDVDFDVTIKTQMRKLASAVQYFTNTTDGHAPYGSTWDILWLGHCGETWWRGRSSLQYPDRSRIPQDQYVGWTTGSFTTIRNNHRLIQWASGPTCSFAYAVTLAGAQKLLQLANKGQSTAFDTELSDLCVFGNLRCISVTPQLFVHYVPDSAAGESTSEVDRENKGKSPGNDEHLDLVMGHTQNIMRSARCMAIFGKPCLPDPIREATSVASDRPPRALL